MRIRMAFDFDEEQRAALGAMIGKAKPTQADLAQLLTRTIDGGTARAVAERRAALEAERRKQEAAHAQTQFPFAQMDQGGDRGNSGPGGQSAHVNRSAQLAELDRRIEQLGSIAEVQRLRGEVNRLYRNAMDGGTVAAEAPPAVPSAEAIQATMDAFRQRQAELDAEATRAALEAWAKTEGPERALALCGCPACGLYREALAATVGDSARALHTTAKTLLKVGRTEVKPAVAQIGQAGAQRPGELRSPDACIHDFAEVTQRGAEHSLRCVKCGEVSGATVSVYRASEGEGKPVEVETSKLARRSIEAARLLTMPLPVMQAKSEPRASNAGSERSERTAEPVTSAPIRPRADIQADIDTAAEQWAALPTPSSRERLRKLHDELQASYPEAESGTSGDGGALQALANMVPVAEDDASAEERCEARVFGGQEPDVPHLVPLDQDAEASASFDWLEPDPSKHL